MAEEKTSLFEWDEFGYDKKNLPHLPHGYEYVKRISHGTQGVVWQVFNNNMARYEAVKILRGMSSQEFQRFQREIQTIAGLSHPYIVTIYYANLQHGYFIMEYLSAGSLTTFLQRDDFDLLQGAMVLEKIAQGLHFAHQRGLVHRDLKPENILFADATSPRITDFGIVKKIEEGITLSTALLGTPEYMSPEQWRDSKEVDHRCDIWALGIILYLMLFNRYPFPDTTGTALMYPTLIEDIPWPHQANSTLQAICMRALAKDMNQRYPNAALMAEDLQKFIDLAQDPQKTPPSPENFHFRKLATAADNRLATWHKYLPTPLFSWGHEAKKLLLRFYLPIKEKLRSSYQHSLPLFLLVIVVFLFLAGALWYSFSPSSSSILSSPSLTSFPETADSEIGWFYEKMPPGMQRSEKYGEYLWHKDRSLMVYVPKGEYWQITALGLGDNKVSLPGFYIDKYEVTLKRFQVFWKQLPATDKEAFPFVQHQQQTPADNTAVNQISWQLARLYCQWADKRLPSEQEWEKAARGGIQIPDFFTQSLVNNPRPKRLIIWEAEAEIWQKFWQHATTKQSQNPVDISPYGCHDLAGSLMEWCQDKGSSPPHNNYRVVKGAAWGSHLKDFFIHSKKSYPEESQSVFLGFRTVVDLHPHSPRKAPKASPE